VFILSVMFILTMQIFLQIHFIFEIQYALIKIILIVLPIVCVFLCGTSDLSLKT